jgi:hypothetical protein
MARRTRSVVSPPVALVLAFMLSTIGAPWASAQTRVDAPANKYSPADDVKIGQQAAAEVRQQFPLVRDSDIDSFVDRIGQRLVEAIPGDYRHPEFRYSFEVVNARDINAFALPGGPMFINRGMIQAARTEGEVAGVMAHELSHVVLRHGTAQASKATKYQIGQLAGQILGSIVGGTAGAVIAQGSSFGLGTAFLRFGREYERQADLFGAQIMARAGYDPRHMANMFTTIEKKGGSGGPEWLSDHPNPGNRQASITREAQALHVAEVADTGQLPRVQSELAQMPQAPTTEQIVKNAERGGNAGNARGPVGTSGRAIGGPVDPPAREFRTYTGSDLFQVSVPANWQPMEGQSSVWFVPPGGTGDVKGQQVFTHGVEVGVAGRASGDLREATEEFVQALSQGNPNLRRQSDFERVRFGEGEGLEVVLSQPSSVGDGQERVVVRTTLLRDGSLFYSLGVAPQSEYSRYRPTFERVNDSIRIGG